MVENTVHILYQAAASDPVPESPGDLVLAPILQKIHDRNAKTQLGRQDAWQTVFIPAQSHCLLCETELTPPTHVPGSNGRAYLLTRGKLIPAKAFIRKCTNAKCEARHSYHTWRDGL